MNLPTELSELLPVIGEEKREIVEIEIAEKVENNASYLRRR